MLAQPVTTPRKHRSRFFVVAAVLMFLTVVAGFSRTFYLRPLISPEQRFPLPLYLGLHGVVMTAWYSLFAVQAFLVASRRVAWHRRLGVLGGVLAVPVVLTGAYVALRMPGRVAELGAPVDIQMAVGLGITIGSLVRLVMFSGLVVAAFVLRRRPQWHSRLMLWSFLLMLDPALGGGGSRPLGPVVESAIGALPTQFLIPTVGFVALSARDYFAVRRLHPATWLGAVAYMLYAVPLPLISATPAAHDFIRTLLP